jgi:hypothetical protein
VNLLSQDLASTSEYGHNLLGEEPLKTIGTQWENPRHSTKPSFIVSTVRNSIINTNNSFQVLDKLHASDSIVATPSEIPQTGKVHKYTKNTGRTCRQEDGQAPVIVNGSTTVSKNTPVKRQSKIATNKKDHKLLIIGDSHARLWTQNVKAQIKNNFHVQGLVKPGAGADKLETSAKSDITSQTKNDVVVVCVGANDIAKNMQKLL